jgi:hypothetical protein
MLTSSSHIKRPSKLDYLSLANLSGYNKGQSHKTFWHNVLTIIGKLDHFIDVNKYFLPVGKISSSLEMRVSEFALANWKGSTLGDWILESLPKTNQGIPMKGTAQYSCPPY